MDPQTHSENKLDQTPPRPKVERETVQGIGDLRNLGEVHTGRDEGDESLKEKIEEVRHLQSQTAREHGGKVPPGSEAAVAQSELDKELAKANTVQLSDPLLNITASRP